MIRTLAFAFLLSCLGFNASAAYSTPGTGVHWTLDSLVAYANGDVTHSGGGVYNVYGTIFISANDTLSISSDATVMYAGGTHMDVNGVLLIDPPTAVVFTAQSISSGFNGLRIDSSNATVLRNFTLEYAVSLRINDSSPLIDSSTFQYNNNGTSTSFGNGAISLFRSSPVITNSQFLNNNRAAIQGGSNIANAPKIINCLFQGNNTTNQNVPQINLGASGTDTTKILNCQILQASTNSGGIGFLPTGTLRTVISGNLIKNNRYGITLAGGSLINALISYNVIDSNNTQNNPNLGGSGIAFSGGAAGNHQNSIVTGNVFRGNLWGITILNRAKPNLGNLTNADTTDDGKNEFIGNTNSMTAYIDLYNNTVDTIYAQNNYWGTTSAATAEDRIFHYNDTTSLGFVIYEPIQTTAPLSVILEHFGAVKEGNTVALEWATSAEKHLSHFNIQRSTDGNRFTTVARVDATGDGNYNYTDVPETNNTRLYYRLKAVNRDGSHSFSKTVSLQWGGMSSISFAPNPAHDVLYITGPDPELVCITDLNGRLVLQQQLQAGARSVDISKLAPGLYLIGITAVGGHITGKLQVVR